jgi:hypothetical protein
LRELAVGKAGGSSMALLRPEERSEGQSAMEGVLAESWSQSREVWLMAPRTRRQRRNGRFIEVGEG